MLPWVLAALVLRALIPAGFMPMAGTSLAAAMCSTLGMPTELIEVPGTTPQLHCDYCVAPAVGASPALPAGPVLERGVEPSRRTHDTPRLRLPLDRAHPARGPPLA